MSDSSDDELKRVGTNSQQVGSAISRCLYMEVGLVKVALLARGNVQKQ